MGAFCLVDLLSLKARRDVYIWIRNNPGCHQRDIQRSVDMQPGHLTYHLEVLQKGGMIVSFKDGNYTRYYPKDTFSEQEKAVLGFLRRELPRGILLFILLNPRTSQQHIAQNFRVTEPTISYHISRMAESGILDSERASREIHYWVKQPETVANLVIAYKQSFLDSLVDVFSRVWVRRE